MTATGASYLRLDIYDAVQAVDRLFNNNPPPSLGGDLNLYYFTYDYTNSDDFYTGFGYTTENYQLAQQITNDFGTYTITGITPGATGTADLVTVTDYYDGSTGFGYANSVLAQGTTGLSSEAGDRKSVV